MFYIIINQAVLTKRNQEFISLDFECLFKEK